MVAPLQHYRWDFYGLSTDDKPTADTSEKVADGSTYYEADTSKLYVWYDDDWYEKEDGGGGTPYELPIATADTLGGVKVGSGLTINSETGALSVSGGPTTVIQNAGAPTTATEGTVGLLLEDTTNGKLYQCTAVNEGVEPDPTTYTWVEVGKDLVDGVIIKNAGAPTTATVGAIGLLLEDTTNGKLYQCTAITAGVDPDPTTYTWTEVGAGSAVTVVQTAGTSTTDVMSQDAATGLVYTATGTGAGHHYYDAIRIGNGVTLDSTAKYSITLGDSSRNECNSSIAIGASTVIGTAANAQHSIAIGDSSTCYSEYAIALGAGASVGINKKGVMSINTLANQGYNGSKYRLLTGLYAPQSDNDAATKGYVDGLVLTNAGAPTTATVGTVGQLLEDTTNGKLYQCTAVATNPDSYTWTEVGAGGGSGPTVVQTTGTSTTDVMSQNAVTGLIFADPSTKRRINIGNSSGVSANETIVIGTSSSVGGTYSIGMGYNSLVNAQHSVGIGSDSYTSAQYSVAIGDGARATVQGEFNIGTGSSGNHGYNSTNYRLLTGVHNPVNAHDAATKDYVDGLVGNVASALNVINNGSNA